MLTVYHAPHSRSDRVVWLLEEIGAPHARIDVDIRRNDGSGARDPRNPHPDGKVPALVHDGALVTETAAILLYLTDLFPDAGLGPTAGQAGRGAYLTWLAWYGATMEPAYLLALTGYGDDPILRATVRGPAEAVARIEAALDGQDFLLGDRFSAADLLVSSPFKFFPEMVPGTGPIAGWIARCTDRPAYRRLAEAGTIAGGG
jgi:glutathione S-transferase